MNTIVVGYDETPPSECALECAAMLAEALHSHLIVTSVAPVLAGIGRSAGGIDPTDPPSRHVAELERARTYLYERGVHADYIGATGSPADTIVALAQRRDAHLIVVGSRRHGLIRRFLGHGVSASVVHKASCSVLVVREPHATAGLAIQAD